MNYSEIKSLQELQSARKQLAVEIQGRETAVVEDFKRLKLLLSPVYWLQRAFRNWQTLSRTWSLCMRGYRTIQEFLARRKAARTAARRREEAEPSARTETGNVPSQEA